MTDSTSTTPSSERILHQEVVRNVDVEPPGVDPWRPLHDACDRICLQKPADDLLMRRVGKLWNGRQDVELRLLGYATEDLEFLRYFPGLTRLNVQAPTIRNIDGLRHVAGSLKEFTLASTTVSLSVRPVAGCAQLESLHLQRQRKDFGALRSLARLRYLGLSGIQLPDLAALLPFERLQSLFLGFCKPVDLGLLGRFSELEALHILKITNLRDLSALTQGRGLKRIALEWLPHVKTLPDLSGLTRLEEVEVESMKSLNDISAIASAPALRFLGLWACNDLPPQSFKCLVGHPTLQRLNFGVGRLKDNNAIAAMFPEEMLQTVYYRISLDTWLRRPTP